MINRQQPDLRKCELIFRPGDSATPQTKTERAGCLDCCYEDMCPYFNMNGNESQFNMLKRIAYLEEKLGAYIKDPKAFEECSLPE